MFKNVSKAVRWIWCMEKPIQANSKTEWLARATLIGSLRPTEHKADLGRLVFWYSVGAVVMYRQIEQGRAVTREQEWAHLDDNEAARQDINTEAVNDMDITVPRIIFTEFMERPGLYGNVDPDVTRYTLCYDADDLEASGILAQLSRKEFEKVRDMDFRGYTVGEAKVRIAQAMADSARLPQF